MLRVRRADRRDEGRGLVDKAKCKKHQTFTIFWMLKKTLITYDRCFAPQTCFWWLIGVSCLNRRTCCISCDWLVSWSLICPCGKTVCSKITSRQTNITESPVDVSTQTHHTTNPKDTYAWEAKVLVRSLFRKLVYCRTNERQALFLADTGRQNCNMSSVDGLLQNKSNDFIAKQQL